MWFFGLALYVNIFLYLDSQPCPEGSNEIGSVCPAVCHKVSSGLAHWFFFRRDIVLRGPYMVVHDSFIFRKRCCWAKCPKMTENDVKWKYLWSFNILQKVNACEKSGSQVMAKNPLSKWHWINQWGEVYQCYVITFSEKILVFGKCG